jgi:flagellar motility protein MotE (MotC chaperone)
MTPGPDGGPGRPPPKPPPTPLKRPALSTGGTARRASALLFLSMCFIASAAIRVGDLGIAVAQTAAEQTTQAATRPNEPTVLRPDALPVPGEPTLAERAAVCDAEPGPLLEAIRERVAMLEQRERQVAERERLLEVTEARIRAEIARLEEAEEELSATLALADGASERDVAHLVGVYETMKAKQAAIIFSSMDPEFAAGFLARMRPDAAAGILGQMEAGAAYAVTAVMAGRHVDAGLLPAQRSGTPPRQ